MLHPVPLPLSITRTPACLPACLQVLEQLLEENDQDPNVWLLLAICYQGGGDLEAALEAGQRKGTHTHSHARTCSAGLCTCARCMPLSWSTCGPRCLGGAGLLLRRLGTAAELAPVVFPNLPPARRPRASLVSYASRCPPAASSSSCPRAPLPPL